jgi:mono/diheme cytochrome c family protein
LTNVKAEAGDSANLEIVGEALASPFGMFEGGGMIDSMKFRAMAIVWAVIIGAPAIAFAAGPVDVGKREYDAACAVCHGVKGKGDGPLKEELKSGVPDLTVLARNNNGVFPFDRVYQVIDGRREVKVHGPRDMPVWGHSFRSQSSVYFEDYPSSDPESSARSRILALTEYLYRLQSK